MTAITLRDDSKITLRTVIGRGPEHPEDALFNVFLRVSHGYPAMCSMRTGCTGRVTRLLVADIDEHKAVQLSACEECYARGTVIADSPPSDERELTDDEWAAAHPTGPEDA
jgi:hypothetical protein